jgi:hypothetical protein
LGVDAAEQAEAVGARHAQVGEHHVHGALAAEDRQRGVGAFGGLHGVMPLQRALEAVARVLVVVHDQNDRFL